ncbi:sulfatase [Crateriforma conspicua]|uniref:Choline-sulfatase n=1 Tax=Crateriforma conspicua TaxID=2527996 RepID=A0A5C5Y565_9PLAN|nr:sulfatase [Crateriforma conspicua]TWT70866.1 Choline-sulfatase [Crateriforma conspicua]
MASTLVSRYRRLTKEWFLPFVEMDRPSLCFGGYRSLCSVAKFPLAILVGTLLGICAATVDAETPKSVLMIAVDDLGAAIRCYGDPVAVTPNIDRLASRGVKFDRAYNQLPLCNPSRASVMTGLRPDAIKVYDLARHFREELPGVVTLPQAFQKAGYQTRRVGKIFHYAVPAAIGTDGFDDPVSWDQVVNPKGRDKREEHLVFNAEPHRKISASLSWLAADGTDEEQTDGMVATQAIQWLEDVPKRPQFIAAGFFRPHTPYIAPKKYFDLYPLQTIRLPWSPENDRDDIPTPAFAHNCPVPNYGLDSMTLRKAIQAYYATVSFVDAQVGRILDAVDAADLWDDLVIVFWSDHGYHLGEHDGVWQKRTLFEQGALTPLIMYSPEAKGNGASCDRIVEFVDIFPTCLQTAGVPLGDLAGRLHGRSLVPLLDQPLIEDWNGSAVTQVLRPADQRLATPVMGRSVRTRRYRYTEWNGGDSGVELYDHHSDPMEFHNLATQPDESVRRSVERLRELFGDRAIAYPPTSPFEPAAL